MFEFQINRENATVTVRREFVAELEKVWKAWTVAEILDKWWAPSPWTSKTKSMIFEKGGHRHYAMCGPSGEEHWGMTKYTEIVPFSLIVGEDYFCDEDTNVNMEMPSAWFDQTFERREGRTVVTIETRYADLSALEFVISMGFKEGMTAILEQLDELLNQN